jgi:hypothetical protein
MMNTPDSSSHAFDAQIAGQVSGQIAVGQNITQSQIVATGNQLETTSILDALKQLSDLIQTAPVPESVKQTANQYLEAAKAEVQQQQPDKELIAKSLNRMTETLDAADKTVDSGKRFWKLIKPLLVKIATWLGAAAGKFMSFLP